jgi:hypothetical protein
MYFRMKIIFSSVLVVMFCLLLCAPAGLQADTHSLNIETGPGDVPKIVFENQTHDFGTVPPGVNRTHSFTFKNTGTADLSIKDVKAG